MPRDLSKMSVEELLDANEGIMAKRSEAERGFKEQQHAIQVELTRRGATTRLSAALEGLTPEQRTAVLADLQAAAERED
ncbi:hypothetical protein BH23CHL8_BH23CHL8_30480 [soil metagenome]